MKTVKGLVAFAALVAFPTVATAGERAQAMVSCQETAKKLVFDCQIMLMGAKSKRPLTGAAVVVKADMPSMPMAHNVRPVKAMAMGKPGMYHAKLHLEMYGEWALKMTVTGPTRDIVIRKVRFGTEAAGKMDHGAHGKHKMKKMEHKKHTN
jgi:hypothetical protein